MAVEMVICSYRFTNENVREWKELREHNKHLKC
jgi:hypothetical protein